MNIMILYVCLVYNTSARGEGLDCGVGFGVSRFDGGGDGNGSGMTQGEEVFEHKTNSPLGPCTPGQLSFDAAFHQLNSSLQVRSYRLLALLLFQLLVPAQLSTECLPSNHENKQDSGSTPTVLGWSPMFTDIAD